MTTLVPQRDNPTPSLQHAPPAFHLLAKPTGAVCNLDCSYCFFLSKEMLYPGSRFRMADELLETYLRQLIEAHSRVPEVTIAWQGGEPTLMGVDFFRRSVELAESFLAPGQRALYTIQTNGTLLDSEWAAFLDTFPRWKSLHLEGCMTHLADSDGNDSSHTEQQLKTFRGLLELVRGLRFVNISISESFVFDNEIDASIAPGKGQAVQVPDRMHESHHRRSNTTPHAPESNENRTAQLHAGNLQYARLTASRNPMNYRHIVDLSRQRARQTL